MLDGVWKVSPLRSDMFWNDSINEGFVEGLRSRAGRRRGLAAVAVDMLKNDRGDVPFMLVEDRSAVSCAALASSKRAAMERDSRLNAMTAAAVLGSKLALGL